jgi:hypothetical protein
VDIRPRAVIVTTTFYRPEKGGHDKLRFKLACQTIQAAQDVGIPIIVVDDSPTPVVAQAFSERGAIVYKQTDPGMGAARRQVLRYALESGAQAIAWVEPEKEQFPHIVGPVFDLIRVGYDIVVPKRASLDSLPPFQAESESIANEELNRLFTSRRQGKAALDLMFGPRVMSRKGAELLASYVGEDGRDNWEILFLPVLQALATGLHVTGLEVNYTHPREQTAAETGDKGMDEKRVFQRQVLVAGMTEEAKRLGLI